MPKDPDYFDIKEHKVVSRLSPRFLSRVLEQRYMFDAAGVATVTNDQNISQDPQGADNATDGGTGSDNATHSSSDNSISAILSDVDQSIIATTNVTENTSANSFGNHFSSDNINMVANTFSVGSTAPVIVAPSSLTILEDNTLKFNGNGNLSGGNSIVVSSDSSSLEAILTATNGTLSFTNFTGTLSQLNAELANLTYTPNADFPNSTSPAGASITISVNDGMDVTTKAIDLIINPVQDSPVVGSNSSIIVNEDNTKSSGSLVSNIMSSTGARDVDGQSLGMGITSIVNPNGMFQYSTDSGVSWNNFGVIPEGYGFLLLPTDRIRFVPDLNYHGSGAQVLEFKAWDQTSGTAHTFSDTRSIFKVESQTQLSSGMNEHEDVSVAIRQDGSAVYVWDAYPNANIPDLYKTTTDSNGTITSEQVSVYNSATSDDEAQIVIFSDQGYAVVWESSNGSSGNDVFVQFYDVNHNPVGVEKRININIGADQGNILPSVALLPNDDFIVYWTLEDFAYGEVDVRATILDRNGNVVTPEFTVNQTTTGEQSVNVNVAPYDRYHSTVATSANGTILMTWRSDQNAGQGYDVYGRLFNSSGAAISNEFLVNTSQEGDQYYSVTAMAPDGRFAIAWESTLGDGSGTTIYARFFNADGSAATPEFIVNQTTSGDQKHPSIAMDKEANLYVVWDSPNVTGGSGEDIIIRKFSFNTLSQSDEFIVNPSVAGNQLDAAIALDQSGKFILVAYEDDSSGVKKVYSVKLSEPAFSINSRTLSVHVLAANDGPVVDVPGAQNVNEDTSVAITGISFTDVDLGGNEAKVTLSATQGTLTLGTITGLTFLTGDGTGDGSMSFRGTLADLNLALASLSYKGNLNFTGSDLLTVTINDQGHTGGPVPSVNKTIAIKVNPVNDPPEIDVPGEQTTNKNTSLAIKGISFTDVDLGGNRAKVTLSVTRGTLTLGTITGLSFLKGDGTGDASMSFIGKLTDLNLALASLSYKGSLNFTGSDLLTVTIDDQGHTGAGGAFSNTQTIPIKVTTSTSSTSSISTSIVEKLTSLAVKPDVSPLPQTGLKPLVNSTTVKETLPTFSDTEKLSLSTSPSTSEKPSVYGPGTIKTLEIVKDFMESGKLLSDLEVNDYTEDETELLSKDARQETELSSNISQLNNKSNSLSELLRK